MQLHIMALHENTIEGLLYRSLTAVDDVLVLSLSRLPASCRLPASVPRLADDDSSGRWLWLVSGAMMTQVSSSSCSAHRVVSCRHSTMSQSAALSTGKKKSGISRVSAIQSIYDVHDVREFVHGGDGHGSGVGWGGDDGCVGRVCSYCYTKRECVRGKCEKGKLIFNHPETLL